MRRVWLVITLAAACIFLIGCGGGEESLRADAGEDFDIQIGESPNFDGCNSTGDIQNYRWTIVEAPSKMAADSGKVIREVDANCSFTLEAAMGVDEVGAWEIELEVRDGDGQTSTDRVTVTVNE